MRTMRKLAVAAGAMAASTVPATTLASPAGAGSSNYKTAAAEWQDTFPTPSGVGTITCRYRATGVFEGGRGTGALMVLDGSDPGCAQNLNVEIRYTNVAGVPAVVGSSTTNGWDSTVVAHDVLEDMTVRAWAWYHCNGATALDVCVSGRTLTPK
jgi:hypothetical protein